jgi:hypothetical protein
MRKYLPTLAELIDRRSIVLLKEIFIPENKEAYREEGSLIEHDINEELNRLHGEKDFRFSAYDLRMIMMVMLSNRWIWENEASIRSGADSSSDRLIASHSVNGVRNTAKNNLAAKFGERKDLKVDCLAADFPSLFGNWNVFS